MLSERYEKYKFWLRFSYDFITKMKILCTQKVFAHIDLHSAWQYDK